MLRPRCPGARIGRALSGGRPTGLQAGRGAPPESRATLTSVFSGVYQTWGDPRRPLVPQADHPCPGLRAAPAVSLAPKWWAPPLFINNKKINVKNDISKPIRRVKGDVARPRRPACPP
ncbi:hypothetical protein NDU88_003060 [Pleurodeles waltl]|uniref:Uncharacterized protein n=1 Tax=Pleurodeles waltl TaxID=8319 RepID=A0AAV7UB36_PLEWA|nr:hypothetical protein NDU88_003060 [Pleurodeles waltl]